MRTRATVPASYVRALLNFAVQRGADRRTLLDRTDLGPEMLGDPDNRVLLESCVRLMHAAATECHDPAFSLRFGEAVKTEDVGVPLLLAGLADTVEAARVQVNRHARLLRDDDDAGEGDVLEVVRDARGIWLAFRGRVYATNPCLVEAGLAWCVCETRKMLTLHFAGRPFLKAVHFTHETPAYRSDYERVFDVPLVFSSDRNALLVDEAFLSLRMPGANPYVLRVMEQHAAVLLQRLRDTKTTRGMVESLLIPRLATPERTMDAIARQMGLSRQGLSRKLKIEGVTFEQVLDDLRRTMATAYLADAEIRVSDAANRLGFSEPAAFSRAYKRWTGTSPRAARARRRE